MRLQVQLQTLFILIRDIIFGFIYSSQCSVFYQGRIPQQSKSVQLCQCAVYKP